MPKIPKGTPRVAVSWGKDKVTTSSDGKTKTETKVVTSMVFENVAKLFNLPLAAKSGGIKTKTITTKGGKARKVIDGASSSSVSPKHIMISTGSFDTEGRDKGDQVWHRVAVPPSISLADIVDVLIKTNKVYAVKWPRGRTYIISQDRKAEPGGSPTKGASR
jgi:hypothetical protein